MAAGALSSLIKYLVTQVAEEITFQYAVSDKIRELIRQLEWTRAFLEDAEQKQRGDSRIRQWIDDVRDISYSLEDEFEKYSLVMEKRRHPNWVLRHASIFEFLVKSHQIGTSIDRLQKRIEGISISRSAYGITNFETTSRTNEPDPGNLDLLQQRRLNALKEDFSFVGLQNDLNTLKERLLDTKEKRRCCISVVGMGGLGKTTIAKKVYTAVRTHFQFSTLVYISKEFNIKDILEKISTDIKWSESDKEKDEIMKDEEKLRRKINEYLKGNKYLVVLDDVWSCQTSQYLKTLFPDVNNGSRLLLTTRNEEVARDVDPITPLHNLRLLDKDESWELFCQKAFIKPKDDPERLLDLGKRINEKCKGLPLAIEVLGGLLSRRRKEAIEWEIVLGRISLELGDSPERCKAILAMSYNDLPFKMKPCFLYFGLFPEDTSIPAKKLIHFWVAENLVQAQENEKLEDAAQACLDELIRRSLVQVVVRKHDGGVKLCRIHDLLRDFAIEESRKDNFLHRRGPESAEGSANVCRLSIQSEVSQETEGFNQCTNRLRSLFIMSYIPIGKVKELIPKMQLLRILDITKFPSAEFPEEINQLIHLRYLGLRLDRSLHTSQNLKYRFPSIFPNCCFEFINPCVDFFGRTRLPPTPSNLKYLQTLNFSDSYGEISHSIWTLRQLRHLYGKHLSIVGDAGDQSIDGLKNLHTLHLGGGDWINNGLEKLSNLRDLRIYGDLSKYHEGISKALRTLFNLKVLKLSTNNDGKIPQFPSLSHLRNLTKMVLVGPIESLPGINEFPPYLSDLSLFYNALKKESDPFATLQNLKELKYLKLKTDKQVNEINVFSGGFPKLEELYLDGIIENFNVFSGGFPKLEALLLDNSSSQFVSLIGKFNIFPGGFPKLELLYLDGIIGKFNVFPGGFPKLEKFEFPTFITNFNVFRGGFPKLEKLELTTTNFNVFPGGFPKLENLRLNMSEEEGEFNDSFGWFPILENLRLNMSEEEGELNDFFGWFPKKGEFNVFSGGFPKLEVLELGISMVKFNVFSGGFPKLTVLKLELWAENEIKVFSDGFPKLERLKLKFSEGDQFYVDSGAFPKLEELTLVAPEEYTLYLEEGSLRRLKRLIMLSPKVKYIPDAVKSMEFLEELKLSDISIELFNRVQQGGEDWHKIEHVSNIYVDPP